MSLVHSNCNNACAETGCGRPMVSPEHDPFSRHFAHRYIGARSARRRALRAKAPAVCQPCASGKHNGRHTEYGCIETVDKPDGYVCGCSPCRLEPSSARIPIRRSDSHGVTFVQFGAGL